MELTTLAPTVASPSRTTNAHVAMERLVSSVAFEGFSKKVDIKNISGLTQKRIIKI